MKKNKLVLVLASFLSILFLAYIFKMTRDIGRLEEVLVESPNIIDVTKQIKTKIQLSDKEFTDASWSDEAFNDSSWKSVSIPDHLTVKEPNFKTGNYIYYRIHLRKEAFKDLSNLKNELSFALQFIQLSKFDIYINGKFYRTSTPKGPTEFLTIIPINELQDNIIAIKGFIKDGDSGIYHRSKLMVGKGGELNDLYSGTYKSITVMSLIYILCKGSILLLFTLIFIVLKVDRFFEKSLLYVMFVILEDIMTGDYVTQILNMNYQVYVYNLANIGINLFLFLFLADVLEKKYSKIKIVVSLVILTIVSYLIAFDILHTSYLFNFDHYLKFWNYVFIAILLFVTPQIIKKEKVLSAFIVTALGMTLWSAFFSENIGYNLKAFANLIIFFGVAYQTFILFRREQLQIMEQEKDVAIGKTAAILAHDVRRPLQQMNMILERISSGEASDEFLRVAKADVDFSITSVNNHINDIINFSRTKEPELKPVSFYSLLSRAIKQVSNIKSNVHLKFNYDFKSSHKVMGDESRLASVLLNLIANSAEAIRDIGKKENGIVNFSTFNNGKSFFIRISNNGPLIPEKIIGEIFKPLFTSGKTQGTGLGLASAAKIVSEHNGKISVKNLSECVEFTIELSKSSEEDKYDLSTFLASSSDYAYKKDLSQINTEIEGLRILLLDDENFSYEYVRKLVESLSFNVELTYINNTEAAAKLVKSKRFDLYLLDYDLGEHITGLDFYSKNLSFLSQEVFLMTNRESGLDEKNSLRVLPKNLSIEKLSEICVETYKTRKKIFLVEDSKLISLAWTLFHGKHNIKSVSDPSEALAYLNTDPTINICVLDYYYDGSDMNGEELARIINSKIPVLDILISTSAQLESKEFQVIRKNDYEIRKISMKDKL